MKKNSKSSVLSAIVNEEAAVVNAEVSEAGFCKIRLSKDQLEQLIAVQGLPADIQKVCQDRLDKFNKTSKHRELKGTMMLMKGASKYEASVERNIPINELQPGDNIVDAFRCWTVKEIDIDRNRVMCCNSYSTKTGKELERFKNVYGDSFTKVVE